MIQMGLGSNSLSAIQPVARMPHLTVNGDDDAMVLLLLTAAERKAVVGWMICFLKMLACVPFEANQLLGPSNVA